MLDSESINVFVSKLPTVHAANMPVYTVVTLDQLVEVRKYLDELGKVTLKELCEMSPTRQDTYQTQFTIMDAIIKYHILEPAVNSYVPFYKHVKDSIGAFLNLTDDAYDGDFDGDFDVSIRMNNKMLVMPLSPTLADNLLNLLAVEIIDEEAWVEESSMANQY